jgi:hypothetical protein
MREFEIATDYFRRAGPIGSIVPSAGRLMTSHETSCVLNKAAKKAALGHGVFR